MTKEQEKIVNESIRWLKYSVEHEKGMIFIGYNDQGKQFMGYTGNSENLVNLAARTAVHICESCKYSFDDFVDGIRKYTAKWEAEKNEKR